MNMLSILFITLTAIISVVLPIGLMIYFKRKYNASILYFIVGIIVFSLFQIFTRIPMLHWLSGQFWFTVNILSNNIVYILFLALTAGIFEEVGRFLAFKFVLTNNREWKNGLVFGIGHGGIEAITMVGINYLIFIIIILNMNFQWFDTIVSIIPNVSIVNDLLLESSPYLFLMAGLERLFVIIIHMGLSLFQLNGVRVGKKSSLLYAIALHTLLNFSIILASTNVWMVEVVVAIAAIISICYIKHKKNIWKFVF
ncbi:YhfC family intramembrane metalloprotease [Alkalibaculum sp. M08DMB]|uniref:YhfC family intramembrane metalloprotease n=1 Tax=Alkalibaculum sporogenes TaxID=2655001 RepID=A0A6A7K5Z5_9FIRM|nr:YhfC family glutamic-type intramembrane protease [Alkalibaculum sporogenes]MPW24909.1 YhfC family intramembrane metalloprotease [Alkalibaculum sporogenes]